MRCYSPITIRNKSTQEMLEVPCNRCMGCLKRRTSQWSFRLMQEYKNSVCAHFVTLTYDNLHVPISDNRFMTLNKKDLQNYMKRLRKLQLPGAPKLKYYGVGEYGSLNERPHYHMILFNAFEHTIPLAWSLDGVMIGDVHVGEVNYASCGYCCDYVNTLHEYPKHARDDRQRPFSNMSKHLGESYITKDTLRWHLREVARIPAGDSTIGVRDRYYNIIDSGVKISMSRYYRDKIFPKLYREVDKVYLQKVFDDRELKLEMLEPDRRSNQLAYIHTQALEYSKRKKRKKTL